MNTKILSLAVALFATTTRLHAAAGDSVQVPAGLVDSAVLLKDKAVVDYNKSQVKGDRKDVVQELAKLEKDTAALRAQKLQVKADRATLAADRKVGNVEMVKNDKERLQASLDLEKKIAADVKSDKSDLAKARKELHHDKKDSFKASSELKEKQEKTR